jgi:hypothetical protein
MEQSQFVSQLFSLLWSVLCMNIYVSTMLTVRYYIIGSVELKTGRPEIICVEINMRDFPTLYSGCLGPFGLFALSDVWLFNIFSMTDEGYLRSKHIVYVNLDNYVYFLYQTFFILLLCLVTVYFKK